MQFVLNLDCSEADDNQVKIMATEAVKAGDFLNFDHAYESMWDWFEGEINALR